MNIKTNGDFNRVQINLSQDTAADGSIIKKSLMLNIREDSVEKACELYRELLSKVEEGAEGADNITSQVQAQINSNVPKCPLCGTAMVLRVNGKKGSKFWGCVNFPQCKGVRQHQEALSAEQLIPVE